MGLRRSASLTFLSIWFLLLYVGGLLAISSTKIFDWTQETLAGTIIFFVWGNLLSFIFLAFCLIFLIDRRKGRLANILLRLHTLYIFPCVILETLIFDASTKFVIPEDFLGLMWAAVAVIITGFALKDLALGKLASLMENVHPILRCALILPIGLSVWNLCLMVFLNVYVI